MPQLPPHLSIWVTLFSARLHEAKQCGIGATQCASSSRTTQLHEAVQCGFGLCCALPAISLLIGPSNIHLVAEVIRFCQTNLLRKKIDCCSVEGKTYQDGIVQICRTIDIQLYNRVASFTLLQLIKGRVTARGGSDGGRGANCLHIIIQSKHCFLKSARLKSQNLAFTIVDWKTLLIPQFVDQSEGIILSGLLIGQSSYN